MKQKSKNIGDHYMGAANTKAESAVLMAKDTALVDEITDLSRQMWRRYSERFLDPDFCDRIAIAYVDEMMKVDRGSLEQLNEQITGDGGDKQFRVVFEYDPKKEQQLIAEEFADQAKDYFFDREVDIAEGISVPYISDSAYEYLDTTAISQALHDEFDTEPDAEAEARGSEVSEPEARGSEVSEPEADARASEASPEKTKKGGARRLPETDEDVQKLLKDVGETLPYPGEEDADAETVMIAEAESPAEPETREPEISEAEALAQLAEISGEPLDDLVPEDVELAQEAIEETENIVRLEKRNERLAEGTEKKISRADFAKEYRKLRKAKFPNCKPNLCQMTKRELCEAIAIHYIVRANIIAAIMTILPKKQEDGTYRGGYCYQRLRALDTGSFCLPRPDVVKSRKTTEERLVELSRYINTFDKVQCARDGGLYREPFSEEEIVALKTDTRFNREYVQYALKMQGVYYNSLGQLADILRLLDTTHNISNATLNQLGEKTKEIIDVIYRTCNEYYTKAVLAYIWSDLQTDREKTAAKEANLAYLARD